MSLTLDMSPHRLNRALLEMAQAQTRQMRRQNLVLYAGASLLDFPQREMMTAELSSMPYMGPLGDKEQPGASIVSELERFATEMACHTFRANWAEMRLPSCTIANLAVFSFFGGPGELLLGPAACDGGHLSQRRDGTPTMVGMRVEDLPFNARAQTLDETSAAAQIRNRKPIIIVLGRSVIVKPDQIKPVVRAARETGALVVYDASHVLGLIAGGVFPNPLDAGVDIVTSSTYKTLRGPAGGVVFGRDRAKGVAFSRFVDQQMLANQNASRLPAMISAMRSCHPDTGYAQRILDTAQSLKERLLYHKLDVLLPDEPAATHQVVVAAGSLELTTLIIRNLEVSGILVGRCPVPGSPGEYGLRFGTQVLAALMFRQSDWKKIGDLVDAIVKITISKKVELKKDTFPALETRLKVHQLLGATIVPAVDQRLT